MTNRLTDFLEEANEYEDAHRVDSFEKEEIVEEKEKEEEVLNEKTNALTKELQKIRRIIYDNLYKLDIKLSGGYTGNAEEDLKLKMLHDHVVSLLRAKGDPLFDFIEWNKIIENL